MGRRRLYKVIEEIVTIQVILVVLMVDHLAQLYTKRLSKVLKLILENTLEWNIN
jgi:hypothetical protein